jgi:hypothetical protein
MSEYLRIDYCPEPDAEPVAELHPFGETVGIPAVYLGGHDSAHTVQVSLHPRDPAGSIRYLRQLAAAATDLADKVERAAAEAVLGS